MAGNRDKHCEHYTLTISYFRKALLPRIMKRLTLLLTGCMLSLWSVGQILGEPVVYWDFAAGIPDDWTNTGANGEVWEYRGPSTDPDLNTASQGSCGTTSVPVQSISVDNGYLIFDSAWWDDNDGTCDGSGGPVPGPHDATLTTGAIDLSAMENYVLTFQQFARHYQAFTTVDISVDGGSTWEEIHSNGEWYAITDEDDWVTVNITEFAAGQSDVRIRFHFEGDHYWWEIDDVAIYTPNDNDVQIATASYALFNFNQEPDGYGDIEYSVYPSTMLSPLNIRSRVLNIGGNPQTGVQLTGYVSQGETQVFTDMSNAVSLNSGAATTLSLDEWTPSAALPGDYTITYAVNQNETDEDPSNNAATRRFGVHPWQYGRDEDETEGQYLGIPLYYESEFEMGNLFESREPGMVIHSVGVALGDSTTVGTTIHGRIYYRDSTSTVLAESEPYTVNAWDLNSAGDSKFVWLPLVEPVVTFDTTLYFGVIHHGGGMERARIAQSGIPPAETTILRYPATNSTFYMPTTPMVRLGWYEASEVPGCTNPDAEAYSPEATIDDGTCRYPGCTFEAASNYDPDANWDDGSCLLVGCTDPEADNYEPNATTDDGSCEYWGCTDPNADNFDATANTNDGSCLYSGCTDEAADNFDPIANVEDGSCIYLGCMDEDADNYDANANQDDGSCEYLGCTNPDAENYDSTANVDDGSCVVLGCTDPDADNYNPEATDEDDSCIYVGCMDPEADNYDPQANAEGPCVYLGCIDVNALNFDPTANTDDGSCQYAEAFFSVSDTIGCGTLAVTVTNQTIDTQNGTCTFDFGDGTIGSTCGPVLNYLYAAAGTYTITYTLSIGDNTSSYSIAVTVYPEAVVPEITMDSETGALSCSNCSGDETLSWSLNGSPVSDSSTYIPEANGMYTLTATNANGCSGESAPIEAVLGCADEGGINFDPEANVPDDSCLYPEAAFSLSVETGCAPLEVTITNETTLTNGTCSWSLGDGTVVEDCFETYTHTYTDAGSFAITFTHVVSGIETQAVDAVVVIPGATEPIITFDESSLTITCTNCPVGADLQWTIDGAESGETGDTLVIDSNGSYALQITADNGCTAVSSPIDVTTIGVWEWTNAGVSGISVYPNPALTAVWVEIPRDEGTLRIVDLTGRVVIARDLRPGTTKFSFDIGAVPSGAYVVEWQWNGLRANERLIIQH